MRRLIAWSVSMTGALATLSAVAFETLPAETHTIAGFVQVTLDAACPEDYKVPLAGTSSDGRTWTFVLDGVQATCTPRYSVPIVFEGRYVPSAPPCDRVTGAGCPRSIDDERPGYLSVGSLPLNVVLQETTVKYCVSGKCYQGRAILDRTSAPFTSPIVGEPLTGGIAGFGEVTPPGCAPGAMKMPVAAVTDGGPVWLIVRPASVAADCPNPVIGVTNVFVGSWSPSRGGCVPSLTSPGTSLCMGRVPSVTGIVTPTLSLCFPGPACWPGSATLVRA